MKVLGASFFPNYEITNKLRELGGEKVLSGQFRVICKCKSMADANRKIKELTNSDDVFKTAWCSESRNQIELELCDQEDVWIALDWSSKRENYVSKSELLAK